MKIKTINAIICKKFDDFLQSITDETVKELVKKNTIATGGCIASMLLNEPVNDFDFYFRDQKTTEAVAKYYLEKLKESGKFTYADGKPLNMSVHSTEGRVKIVIKSQGVAVEGGTDDYHYFEQDAVGSPETEMFVEKVTDVHNQTVDGTLPKYRPVFASANAITLANNVQLVIRFFGEPAEIHENYDFVHCTNYWTSWDRRVFVNQAALESLLAKELRYVGSKYPICSLIRTRKFIKRGWTINAGQMLKICYQINGLDLNNLNELEEQLTGVDVAYFYQVLAYLKEKSVDNAIDTAYVVEIIDRMF